nr:immunoglobulin light chain junction region [Macaca mulatta]
WSAWDSRLSTLF